MAENKVKEIEDLIEKKELDVSIYSGDDKLIVILSNFGGVFTFFLYAIVIR